MKTNLPNQSTLEELEDGSVKVTTKEGKTFTLSPSGDTHVDLQTIRYVGIQNLLDVESHTITDAFGSRSHVIKFHAGGVARFAFNSEGKLIELSSKDGVGVTVTPEGDVIFHCRNN